jgi:hypothetical protein
MEAKITKKIDEIITTLKKDTDYKRWQELKTIIANDKELQGLLNKYQILNEDSKNNHKELLKIKDKLYDHPIYFEYIKLDNQLRYLVLSFNHGLNSLIVTKKCNPTNGRI